MNNVKTIEALLAAIGKLRLRRGADQEYWVDGVDLELYAEAITAAAETKGLLAFPPSGSRVRIWRPDQDELTDEGGGLRVGSISTWD